MGFVKQAPQSQPDNGTLEKGADQHGAPPAAPQRWMAELPDEVMLSSLSIPGTHDSAAYTLPLPFVATQMLTILEQLGVGVRYFDLRCALRHDEVEMVHGSTYLGLRLSSVLQMMYAWFESHPSEGLIVQIKQDKKPEQSSQRFSEAIMGHISTQPERWRTACETPTLGELRGRIQLFRRFHCARAAPVGIDVTQWQDNPTKPFTIVNPTMKITIQDHYSFTEDVALSDLISIKGGNVFDLLMRAARDPDCLHWYINFTSAYQFTLLRQTTPRTVAVGGYSDLKWEPGINPRLESTLRQTPAQTRCGVVVMDFPELGADQLIDRIILTNFTRHSADSRTLFLQHAARIGAIICGMACAVWLLLSGGSALTLSSPDSN